jgi:hypothetical protein
LSTHHRRVIQHLAPVVDARYFDTQTLRNPAVEDGRLDDLAWSAALIHCRHHVICPRLGEPRQPSVVCPQELTDLRGERSLFGNLGAYALRFRSDSLRIGIACPRP